MFNSSPKSEKCPSLVEWMNDDILNHAMVVSQTQFEGNKHKGQP